MQESQEQSVPTQDNSLQQQPNEQQTEVSNTPESKDNNLKQESDQPKTKESEKKKNKTVKEEDFITEYKFKARPVPKYIKDGTGAVGIKRVQPRPLTVPAPFTFNKIKERKKPLSTEEQILQECKFQFKARKLPNLK